MRVYGGRMQVIIALVVLAVAAGFAVVYWRTSPRHRVAVAADRDRSQARSGPGAG